jgi:hypothetical protein
VIAKEMAIEGAITSFKLLMSLYLPLASKNLKERTIRKVSLLVCESILMGLFGTHLGGDAPLGFQYQPKIKLKPVKRAKGSIEPAGPQSTRRWSMSGSVNRWRL